MLSNEGLEWYNQLSNKELIKDRNSGVRSILYILFHIVDIDYSWLRSIQVREDVAIEFTDYDTLVKVKSISDKFRNEIAGLGTTLRRNIN